MGKSLKLRVADQADAVGAYLSLAELLFGKRIAGEALFHEQ
jgi:hypothetical protein